ncbi:MAG: hypothetical protein ACLRFJ_01450 [Alphaproteobacteria bacterium]
MRETERMFARTFLSVSGAAVLSHLRKITIERVLGPNATDAELRGLEAQRALVHQIETLIERGK